MIEFLVVTSIVFFVINCLFFYIQKRQTEAAIQEIMNSEIGQRYLKTIVAEGKQINLTTGERYDAAISR